MKKQKQSFKLKSYPNGLELLIRPDAEMEVLLQELAEKFQNSRNFFGNLQVSLAISGKKLTEEEEDAILDVIYENSDLQIICLIGNDERLQYLFYSAEEGKRETETGHTPDGQFYRGTLKKGQSLETEHSVIILGDVNAGARVFSRGDVIVLGALSGEVHAGMDEKEGHFVCALEFSPEKLKIGSYKYKKKPDKKLWPGSHKKTPKIATLQGDEIIVNPVTKELLGKIAADGGIDHYGQNEFDHNGQ